MIEKCMSLLLFVYKIAVCAGVYNGNIVSEIEETGDELRIIKSYSKEFPYMIEILYESNHLCGAVLITQNAVLTAAHCFLGNDSDLAELTKYKLVAGNQLRADLSGPMVQWRNVKQLIKHYQSSYVVSRDLALLQTDTNFVFTDYIKPINLPVGYNKNDFNGLVVVQMGWGEMENKNGSDLLLSMQGVVRSTRVCIFEWYQENVSLDRRHQHTLLCVKGFKRAVQCWGDSGGPTVLHYKNDPSKDIVIGILTGVFYLPDKTCDVKRPDHIENVGYFITWINDTIDKYFKS